MRKSLQERGKWRHPVPAQEEGEPAPKNPRTGGTWYERTIQGLDVGAPLEKSPEPAPIAAPPADTPDSLPPLENSPTEEGRTCLLLTVLVFLPGLNLNPQCWLEYRSSLLNL